MDPRAHALETVKDLAIQGRSLERIERELLKLGLSGVLHESEIEHIITQATIAREMMPHRPSRKWPRVVGILALLLGMIALPLGAGVGSASPSRYGVIAIVLGLLLILKPDWADTEMD